MYMGTAMAARPIPRPTIIRPQRSTYLSGDTPITIAPIVKTNDANISTGFLPNRSVRGPANAAAIAAAPIVTLTINSCQKESNLKCLSTFNMAPDTTPVS